MFLLLISSSVPLWSEDRHRVSVLCNLLGCVLWLRTWSLPHELKRSVHSVVTVGCTSVTSSWWVAVGVSEGPTGFLPAGSSPFWVRDLKAQTTVVGLLGLRFYQHSAGRVCALRGACPWTVDLCSL